MKIRYSKRCTVVHAQKCTANVQKMYDVRHVPAKDKLDDVMYDVIITPFLSVMYAVPPSCHAAVRHARCHHHTHNIEYYK